MQLSNFTRKLFIEKATQARQLAYCHYSSFAVGAALLTHDEKIFMGCNIENAAYGLCNCAERTAIFNAVSAGYHQFKLLSVIADTLKPVAPCGACRQVMAEFFDSETIILLANLQGDWHECRIDEILPAAFHC